MKSSINSCIFWAEEFEKKFKDVDFNDSDLDYWEEIDKFTEKKIKEFKAQTENSMPKFTEKPDVYHFAEAVADITRTQP